MKGKKEQQEDISEIIKIGNLAKHYIREKELKKINNGHIFQVKGKRTNEVYICKAIKKSKIDNPDKVLRDLAALTKVNHPNLPKIYEVYDSTNFIYIIQEQIEGQSLFDMIISHIQNGETFSEKDAVYFYGQLISAIHCLHAVNISHKDIKPENLLVVENKDPSIANQYILKLLDAGTSKIFGELKPPATANALPKKAADQSKNINPIIKHYDIMYVPMELLQGNYDEKSDVWVATVILYQMLTGLPPFKGETPGEIIKNISRKKIILKGVTLSDEAKDLFKKVFMDYSQRLSSQQILDNEYIKNYEKASAENLSAFDLETFKKFSSTYALKKQVVNLMLQCMSPEDIKILKEKFDAIKNEDGYITYAGLKQTLTEDMENIDKTQIKNYFDLLDIDNDGKIEFNEFIRIALEQMNYCSEELMIKIFEMIDTNNDGYLSKEELKEVLKNEPVNANLLEKLIKSIDTNENNKINFDEFINMMDTIGFKIEEDDENKEENKEEKKEEKNEEKNE